MCRIVSYRYNQRAVHLSETRKGEIFILATSILWSLFPVVTKLMYATIQPLMTAAISTLCAAAFFAFYLTVRGTWRDVLVTAVWKDILIATFYIGIVFYILKFQAIRYTSAGNVSLMGLMEVFFAFYLLGFFLKHERIVPIQISGAICMIAGVVIVLFPTVGKWQIGDLLMIIATAFPPIANMYAQRARRLVSSECIMFFRSAIAGIVLLLLALFIEPPVEMEDLKASAGFLIFNGIVLLGFSKLLWIESIHRIPISKANSLASISPAFTFLFASFFLDETVQISQIIGFIPMLIGVHLLTRTK